MLKARQADRRRKLARYMTKMTRKRQKKSEQYDMDIKVEEQQQLQQAPIQVKKQIFDDDAVWQDPDDEAIVQLNSSNMLKKLKRNDDIITQKQLRHRLKIFKNEEYGAGLGSWAQKGDTHDQKDYEDLLHQDIIDGGIKGKQLEFTYIAKCKQPHRSIVTGVEWRNKVIFSTGLDKTLKVWTFDESSPEFSKTLALQKTVYMENLPLTSCHRLDMRLYMGTLRKNYVVFETEKSKTTLATSSYLSKHQTFNNTRAENGYVGIFSKSLLSLMNPNNQFIGELVANEDLTDVCFSDKEAIGVTKQAIYLWDLRKLRIRQIVRQGLGNNSVRLSSENNLLCVGTRSGVSYMYDKTDLIGDVVKQIDNLVTTITGICVSDDGRLVVPFSKWKRNAVRVIDTSNMSVVATWPGLHTKLNFPTAASFSSHANYMGIGSANGQISVYSITSPTQ